MALVVARHLRFAWLEYGDPAKDDHLDGVTFDRVFSSASLGWRNLFLDLAEGAGGQRVDISNQTPLLDIRWEKNPKNTAEQGLLAFPRMEHLDFLQKWIRNPGVNRVRAEGEPPPAAGAASTLTFGTDATDHADLVAISGHGMRGTVWGDTGALPTAQAYEIPSGTLAPFSAGRLKYLLVATCGNCADFAAPLWLDALRREMPVHGILGYTGTYTGDATGALTMKKFGEAMQKNPNFTILQCWELANRGLPWGAVVLDAAAKLDTVTKWHSAEGLPAHPAQSSASHFDAKSFPTGTLVPGSEGPVTTRWLLPDGSEINRQNGGPSVPLSTRRVLRDGQRGALRLISNGRGFNSGEQMTILIHWVRREKHEMDLDALLTFDPGLVQVSPGTGLVFKLRDANPFKDGGPNGRVDGIRVTMPPGGVSQVDLAFVVNATATKAFPAIADGTHGLFFTEIMPMPGRSAGRTMTLSEGVYLV